MKNKTSHFPHVIRLYKPMIGEGSEIFGRFRGKVGYFLNEQGKFTCNINNAWIFQNKKEAKDYLSDCYSWGCPADYSWGCPADYAEPEPVFIFPRIKKYENFIFDTKDIYRDLHLV